MDIANEVTKNGGVKAGMDPEDPNDSSSSIDEGKDSNGKDGKETDTLDPEIRDADCYYKWKNKYDRGLGISGLMKAFVVKDPFSGS